MEEKLHFEITIQASPKKVYQSVIEDQTYREWTEPFSSGSYYSGSWEKGAKIKFLGPGKSGELMGMVSRIEENIPYQYISIEHLGLVIGESEIYNGPEVDKWKGIHENYTFEDLNGGTVFKVDLDDTGEMREFFLDTWPVALRRLKEISER